jgi:hypothetical protein
MTGRFYISGPDIGHDDFNEPAFRRAAEAIVAVGGDVVVPLDVKPDPHDGECPASYARGTEHSNACYLRADLRAMLDCDAIVLLPGWEASVGARLELSVAAAVGMRVVYPPRVAVEGGDTS